jgi:hypothetical protein
MEADVTRYEQAVPGSLSGNENATTYGDLDPTGDSLLSSLSKSILEMKNAMASFDLDNMMSAPVLTAMRDEGLTGFEADVKELAIQRPRRTSTR